MSRTTYPFPPPGYVKKAADPSKVLNQKEPVQVIVMQGDRKRKAAGKGVKPPPKQVKKAPDSGVPDENVEKKEHGGPAPAAKQDKQTVSEAPESNGRLTSHPLEQAPKGLVDHSDKNDSKKIKRESKEEGEGHAFDMKAEEARLNAVEEGNREDSERWWLRKPKPREARKEKRVEKGRTTVWAEPVLLDEVEVLAMPYVTYL